jgi:hypothetical protein
VAKRSAQTVSRLKSGGDTMEKLIHRYVVAAWRSGKAPQLWKCATIVPVYKRKGERCRRGNHRGIHLLSIAGKVYTTILRQRLKAHRDIRTRDNQAGFRSGRGCVDQIFTLRQLIERRLVYGKPFVIVFVDFAAAFDSVHRESLWKAMAADGVPHQIIAAIRDLYDGSVCSVRVYGRESSEFRVETGVKQGCILSPMLFSIIVDWVCGKVAFDSGGVTLSDNFSIIDLDYADDLALCGEDAADAQRLLTNLSDTAAPVGLQVSIKKTKTLCIGDIDAALSLNGESIETVDSFVYLGASMTSSTRAGVEINLRIGKATGAFEGLEKPLWSRPEIGIELKCRVFRTSVLSVLLYGSETWALTQEDTNKLEVFQTRRLRRLLGISLLDHRTNESVLAECGLPTIDAEIRARRLRWFGHVLRREPSRLVRRCLMDPPPAAWKRKRGGQPVTWRRNVEQDVRNQHFTFKEAVTAAGDRKQWRGVVNVSRTAPLAKNGMPYRR